MKGYKLLTTKNTCLDDMNNQDFVYQIGQTYDHDQMHLNRLFTFYGTIEKCIKHASFNLTIESKIVEIDSFDYWAAYPDYVARTMTIVKEIPWSTIAKLFQNDPDNDGIGNKGKNNNGIFNTGEYNHGFLNEGILNYGNCNKGNHNKGSHNQGNYNTGFYNEGDNHNGCHNHGLHNTGNENRGKHNIGSFNIGNFNRGNHNHGNYNIGDWNRTNNAIGWFNTLPSNTYCMFNKPMTISPQKFTNSKAYKILFQPNFQDNKAFDRKAPYLDSSMAKSKQGRQRWWNKYLSPKDRKTLMNMPNFDADIFYECTGIKV